MSLSLAQALVAGGALVACGAFAASWRREPAGALVALPMLAAGAAICLAGVTRFASRQEHAAGQELAALVLIVSLAAAIVGAAWTRRAAP